MLALLLFVPVGLPSRGGDDAVYVFDVNQPSLPTPFYSVLVGRWSGFYVGFHRGGTDPVLVSISVLFILFLCLFLSLWPFQLYFVP